VSAVELGACSLDIVQLSAIPGRTQELERTVRARGAGLSAFGRALGAERQLVLCVRPSRWWWIGPPGAACARAGEWRQACAGAGRVVDLSSALTALHLAGPASVDVLRRLCRLDLHPALFTPGAAAVTVMAQLSVTMVSLGTGWLLLTPASTGRDLKESLGHAARPFGLRRSEPPLDALWSLENVA